jgi:hypothetical protein
MSGRVEKLTVCDTVRLSYRFQSNIAFNKSGLQLFICPDIPIGTNTLACCVSMRRCRIVMATNQNGRG